MRTRIRACSQVSCNRVWLVHRAWANHQYPLVESDATPGCVHAARGGAPGPGTLREVFSLVIVPGFARVLPRRFSLCTDRPVAPAP